MKSDEEIIRELFGKKKRKRRSPTRCVVCGKVSRLIRCDDCKIVEWAVSS